MKKYKSILFLFCILVLIVQACNLPTAVQAPPMGVVDVVATQTSLALTQAALPNQNPPPPVQPEFTPTITMTPTITPTGTPSIPMVSVSVGTNCRTGPGVVYDLLAGLEVGEKAEVIGKYTSVNPPYWIVKIGSITCWLWGQYATVEGNTANLPEMVPPPSPTPTSTSTPTATPIVGDLSIVDFWMSGNFKIVIRVKTTPANSLSGNYQYTVYSNGAQVDQGTCTVPSNEDACNTNYAVGGVESIQVVIDSANSITESNEGNNSATKNCDKFGFTCN